MFRFSPRVLIALTATALVFPVAARAQDSASADTTLKNLLSNSDVPLTIQMKNMDSSWRRFAIGGNSLMDMQWQLLGAASGFETGVHFTKGQTVSINGETFLIAYRLPVSVDPRVLQQHWHVAPPAPRKPSDLTELSLSLLNLRTTGSLNDLRPFDANKDMENTEQANAASVKTLTQLGQGVMRYIKARGTLPFLTNPIPWDAGRAFYPYVGDERLYRHPSSGEMYRYNEILGGKNIKHLSGLKDFAIFYEATPSADGTRGVLFLDGHVERADAARWTQVKKASKIKNDSGANSNAGMDEGDDEVANAVNTASVAVVRAVPATAGGY